MRNQLIDIYLDFWNNYLTYARYAECNELQEKDAEELIILARKVYYSIHPDA
jgi:hypothetical protein